MAFCVGVRQGHGRPRSLGLVVDRTVVHDYDIISVIAVNLRVLAHRRLEVTF